MQIRTRVFGPVEIAEERLVQFTEPILGFPGLRRFAVLDPDPENPVKWLQSVDREEICFVIADPRAFFPAYEVDVPAARLVDLALEAPSDAAVAVILTVGEDLSKTTANLLAPIMFNTRRGVARQVILDGSGYPIRAPLLDGALRACQGG